MARILRAACRYAISWRTRLSKGKTMPEIGRLMVHRSGGIGSFLLAGVASLALTARVEALTINPTFGAGVTAQAQAAFNFAAAEFQNTYTDPITINITVNAGNSGLG